MRSNFSYAVSYLRGRDEAWVARFLADLERRLDAMSPVRFTRRPADGAADTASGGLAEADVVLVLCSPAYFAEGPADADWAVLAHRTSLEHARGRTGAGTVLPLLWEPIAQRLPDAVAEADTFSAGQPPEYRTLGLALLTMQAARHRAVLDQVLDNLTRRMVAAVPADAGPVAPADLPDVLPQALASDDSRFTALFRAQASGPGPYGSPPRSPERAVRWREGAAERRAACAELAAVGRRLLLVGPAGSGRSRELGALAHRILSRGGPGPWECRVAFRIPAATGALPSPDGIVSVAAPALASHEPAGWAARQLRAGTALLAVEGLDRAPQHLRASAWEWLLRTAETFPRAAFVVETNGTSVPWHRVGAFTPVLLEPLAPADRLRLPGLGSPAQSGTAASGRQGPAGTDADRARSESADSAAGMETSAADQPRAAQSGAAGDLLHDVAAWPGAAQAVRRAAGALPGRGGRARVLRAAVAANWRPDSEAANSRTRVRDSVLRAAAGGLAAATLAAGPESRPHQPAGPGPAGRTGASAASDLPVPPAPPVLTIGTALDALDGLRAGGAAGVPPDRILAQLADEAGLLYAPEPGAVAFTTDAVRYLLAAEHLVAHPGPAGDRLLAAHTARTGSDELALLVAELSVGRTSLPNVPGLLEHAVTGRRLTADPLPSAVPDATPVVVRSLDELLRLAGGPAVPELWCQGPLDARPGSGAQPGTPDAGLAGGLESALAAVPGLRSLVIADHPGLKAVPELGRCAALRSLRLVNCPGVLDVEAVARSGLMFLSVDPWRESFDLAPLGRSRWLRRVELGTAGAPPGAPAHALRLGRAEVRRSAAAGPAADLSRR